MSLYSTVGNLLLDSSMGTHSTVSIFFVDNLCWHLFPMLLHEPMQHYWYLFLDSFMGPYRIVGKILVDSSMGSHSTVGILF